MHFAPHFAPHSENQKAKNTKPKNQEYKTKNQEYKTKTKNTKPTIKYWFSVHFLALRCGGANVGLTTTNARTQVLGLRAPQAPDVQEAEIHEIQEMTDDQDSKTKMN